jgi:hypothetical protein
MYFLLATIQIIKHNGFVLQYLHHKKGFWHNTIQYQDNDNEF